MEFVKEQLKLRNKILENICYTKLVYGRINKKLRINLNHEEIENYMYKIIADHSCIIKKKGKNFYIESIENNIKITVNSNTYRIITADKL